MDLNFNNHIRTITKPEWIIVTVCLQVRHLQLIHPSGPLEEVYSLFPESQTNKVNQILVTIHLTCGTNFLNARRLS